MQEFDIADIKKLSIPPQDSHKGMNGKLLLIGGSHLFHAASLWSLEIASKIVDMVFYASVPENNIIVQQEKQAFRNGIVIWRDHIESYIEEADCILIGPGMVRTKNKAFKNKFLSLDLRKINQLEDEGEQTYYLTKYLLSKYPYKKWVIDAGALQMIETEWLKPLNGQCILTPHIKEFEQVFDKEARQENVEEMAIQHNCIIVLKNKEDIVCSPKECRIISGGNAGMTKGGTGDVLAGLIAALSCTNDMFLAAKIGSYFNKKAGDSLFKKNGYYFNASDLLQEIPLVMKSEILSDN